MTPNILGPVPVIVIFSLDPCSTVTLIKLLLNEMAPSTGALKRLVSKLNVRLPPVRGPTNTYSDFLETRMLKLPGIRELIRPCRLLPGKTTSPLVTFLGILLKLAHC